MQPIGLYDRIEIGLNEVTVTYNELGPPFDKCGEPIYPYSYIQPIPDLTDQDIDLVCKRIKEVIQLRRYAILKNRGLSTAARKKE